ncbi:MAG: hypothetical protein RL033_5282 [Pseudomonadota bacterium]
MSAEPQLPRWTEPRSEAPDELQVLLRDGRAPLGTAQEVAQLSQGLGQLLGAGAGLSATSLAAPAASVGLALGRWAAWAALGLSSAAALWYFTTETPAPPTLPAASSPHVQPVPASEPAPVLEPQAAVLPPSVLPPSVLPPSVLRPAQQPSVLPAAPASEPLPPATRPSPRAASGSEAELLRRAQALLAARPERALALTAEHQRRFRDGALAEEREALAIEALRRLGRGQAAQRRALAFERRYPNSVHASRVRGTAPPAVPER